MLTDELKKCLVAWRCVSCSHELLTMPDDTKTCPSCGVVSHMHGLFSDDREGLLALIEAEVRAEAQGPRKVWSAETVALHFGNSPSLELIANVLNIAIADARSYTAPQSPAPCQKCDEACRTEAEAALRLGKALIEISTLQAKVAELESEAIEQCRIIGMSGEREARHLARIAELEKVAQAYEDQVAAHNKTLDELKYTGLAAAAEAKRGDELQVKVDAYKFLLESQEKRIGYLAENCRALDESRSMLKSERSANKTLTLEVAQQAALIEKCEKALIVVDAHYCGSLDFQHHYVKPCREALAAIAAMKGGAK